VVDGAALVDESAITGQSTPGFHEAGGEHAGVWGGTRVVAGSVVVRVATPSGLTYADA
jgi:K+-transporting ATPase ATPase B chain